jgi:hypothetical protein
MDVTTAQLDIVKRGNLMPDSIDPAPHDGEGQEEADGGEEEPAARSVGNMLVQKGTQRSAMKQQKQQRDHREKNEQEKRCVVPVHAPLNRDQDAQANRRLVAR